MTPAVQTAFDDVHSRLTARRIWFAAAWLTFCCALVASATLAEVSLPRLAAGIPAIGNFLHAALPVIRVDSVSKDLAAWFWNLPAWSALLWDTVLMALLGTSMGAGAALPFSFLASRNLRGPRWLQFACRTWLKISRTIPELVFALLFVYAFGLGPLAGVLAIAVHTMGALGKLFSELTETASSSPMLGIVSTGANRLQIFRFAIIPQVLPGFLSYTLLRFEINVRASSVLGFAGVGGIGQELYVAVRQFAYQDVSAILLLIISVVIFMDLVCEKARRLLAGGGA